MELLAAPRYTIYRRPTLAQMVGVHQKTCACPSCGDHHRNGTQWCLRRWEPMTRGAVKERVQHISQKVDPCACANELDRVYALTSKQFSFLWGAKGAMANAISNKSLRVRP